MHFRTRTRQRCSDMVLQLTRNATMHQSSLAYLPYTPPRAIHIRQADVCGIRGGQLRLHSSKATTGQFFHSPSFGDLSNPIHPVFRADNFIDSTIIYQTIENSLRLASRLITTEQLLPFWYAVLSGPIETTTKPHHPPSQPLVTLTELQKIEVTAKLELLASCITFTSERNWNRGDTGYTERLLLDAPLPFKGVKTNISISKRVFRMIEQSYSKPNLDNESRLWTHFLLANLLLHELAHAAMYAAHPRPPASDPIQAYFLPGACTTEEGMEWEKFVFGGLLYEIPSFLFRDRRKETFGSQIVLREWPNPRLVASYRKSIYPRPFPIKGGLPECDRLWLVPATFFERLFTTVFWERVVPTQGASALQPSRTECFVSRGPLGLLVAYTECATLESRRDGA